MNCSGCGTDVAVIVRLTPTVSGLLENCDICSDLKMSAGARPDVYIGSKGGLQTDMNLCDKKTGEPIPFSTKREKAAIMKNLGVVQSSKAERQHGSRQMNKTAKYREK